MPTYRQCESMLPRLAVSFPKIKQVTLSTSGHAAKVQDGGFCRVILPWSMPECSRRGNYRPLRQEKLVSSLSF